MKATATPARALKIRLRSSSRCSMNDMRSMPSSSASSSSPSEVEGEDTPPSQAVADLLQSGSGKAGTGPGSARSRRVFSCTHRLCAMFSRRRSVFRLPGCGGIMLRIPDRAKTAVSNGSVSNGSAMLSNGSFRRNG